MTRYFLGVDVGTSKTHALIADEFGQVVGFGQSGAGNHEAVGYDGLENALCIAVEAALAVSRLSIREIAGAGFGIAGFDWPSEKQATLHTISSLGLIAPVEAVNDALIGLLAGSAEGWGIAVVAGTGCNCRGWDRSRQHQGQVTGGSWPMGEAAGAGELVEKAVQVVAHAWSKRGRTTQLTQAFLDYTGISDEAELVEKLSTGQIHLSARAAPLVFESAARGDLVATDVLRWAGSELGEMVNAVVRQLNFQSETFDVVLVGSLFNGGSLLIEPLRQTIQPVAPYAQLVRLTAPPVVGAVLLGMEQTGVSPTAAVRHSLQKGTLQIQHESAM